MEVFSKETVEFIFQESTSEKQIANELRKKFNEEYGYLFFLFILFFIF